MTVFEQLSEHYEHTFAALGIEKATELQENILKKVKSGGDLLLIAPESDDKLYAAALACLQKVPSSCEGSPRAILIVGNPDKAKKISQFLTVASRRKELMIEPADDTGKMVQQRIHIFEGADIVVGTPKRIYDLYIQNGINLGELRLIILDNADEMTKEDIILGMRRLTEGLPKCQRMLFTKEMNPKVERISSVWLNNPMEMDLGE
jgi:superfamily II DNA/RNA helicase